MEQSDENKSKVGAPDGNTNAEKWTFEKSKELLEKALELSDRKYAYKKVGKKKIWGYEFDFIGEIACELGTYHQNITRHIPSRHKELQVLVNQLIAKMERNCYANTKRGLIKEGTGIVNLKSNHHWTDRHDHNVKSRNLNADVPLSPEEKKEALKEIQKGLDELKDY